MRRVRAETDCYSACVGTAKPEAKAREEIDRQLTAAGWLIQDRAAANPHAAPGVAIREFPLKGGPVDYGLYVDGAVAGAVEAKKGSDVQRLSPDRRGGAPHRLRGERGPLSFG